MKVTLLTFDHGESVVPLASALSRYARVQLVIPAAQLRRAGDPAPAVEVVTFVKPRLRQALRQLQTARRIRRLIDDFGPDVLHMQQGHLWFNWHIPFAPPYALVVTVHDPRPHVGDAGTKKTPGFVLDIVFRRADKLIAHAEHVKRELVRRCGRQDADVHVIPLAFDRPRPAAQADATPAHVAGGAQRPYTILFFGRIWRYKGLRYLIAAEPQIARRLDDFRIVIAGTGESIQPYLRMMSNADRFDVINSFISDDRREELFDEASVVVLPYIEATQTGVIPLAYRRGTPVVATTVGGLPEVVEDGGTGYLVPPRDAAALAEALIRMADADTRDRMARRARALFDSMFDLDAIAERTYAVYRSALRVRGREVTDNL